MTERKIYIWLMTVLFGLLSCTPHPENVRDSQELPPIYPDYTNVTIPVNIAPLNFLLRGDYEAIEVKAGDIVIASKGNEAVFDMDEWKTLLEKSAGKKIEVTVTALKEGQWTRFKPFTWEVVTDKIDPWLTYRLIEPDYEVFHHLEIHERCVENFEERAISSFRQVGDRCMNCHIHSKQHPDISMMYVRGKEGGAVLNENGHLRKLDIQSPTGPSVYFDFSKTGRYAVFSTNEIIPAFHAKPEKRLEVFDSKSDVYVADLKENRIISSPLLADSTWFETFPTFSPNGKYIYYCTAKAITEAKEITSLQYSLCRIPFDETTGTIGEKADTMVSAYRQLGGKASVCHPKISPDGRHLLYTVADYGTFPIWHREADLRMLDLRTMEIDTLGIVNSNMSDTYHSWSSNSRWFVFASKRDDGLYGKPYFCYLDKNGKARKPFCLPQESPTFYDNFLKSFNVPDLGQKRVNFNVDDVKRVMKTPLEHFK